MVRTSFGVDETGGVVVVVVVDDVGLATSIFGVFVQEARTNKRGTINKRVFIRI
mgnify:CR=1 FL=1|jgi:hypothetical protein